MSNPPVVTTIQPLARGSHFSGFLDDELGKLANLTDTRLNRLRVTPDPHKEFQNVWNETSLRDVSNYLVNIAFFSRPIVVVDGWLVLTPGWWPAFFQPEQYPLVSMLRSGMIRVFSRELAISNLVENAAGRILTYQNLKKAEGYDFLNSIVSRHDEAGLFKYIPWPKHNMDESLKLVLREDLARPLEQLGLVNGINKDRWLEIQSRFQENTDPNGRRDSARQGWLRAILLTAKQSGLSASGVRQLATIGIKAYHKSRSLSLLDSQPNSELHVATIPAPYAQLGDGPVPKIEENFFAEPLLNLSVDWADILSTGHECKLAKLTNLETDLGICKERFLQAREAWIGSGRNAKDQQLNYGYYQDAARKYIEVVHKEFRIPIKVSGPRKFLAKVGRVAISEILPKIFGGVAGYIYAAKTGDIKGSLTTTHSVAAALGHFSSKLPILQQQFEPIAKLKNSESFDPYTSPVVAVMPYSLDLAVAQQHCSALPPFKP